MIRNYKGVHSHAIPGASEVDVRRDASSQEYSQTHALRVPKWVHMSRPAPIACLPWSSAGHLASHECHGHPPLVAHQAGRVVSGESGRVHSHYFVGTVTTASTVWLSSFGCISVHKNVLDTLVNFRVCYVLFTGGNQGTPGYRWRAEVSFLPWDPFQVLRRVPCERAPRRRGVPAQRAPVLVVGLVHPARATHPVTF